MIKRLLVHVLLASLLTVMAALAIPAKAHASPPGPEAKAWSCSQRWSPFRYTNSPHSDHWLYFKGSKNGAQYYLTRGAATCQVINYVWVDEGFIVKYWQYDYGHDVWYLRHRWTKPGWNKIAWYHPPGFKQKFRVYRKG